MHTRGALKTFFFELQNIYQRIAHLSASKAGRDIARTLWRTRVSKSGLHRKSQAVLNNYEARARRAQDHLARSDVALCRAIGYVRWLVLGAAWLVLGAAWLVLDAFSLVLGAARAVLVAPPSVLSASWSVLGASWLILRAIVGSRLVLDADLFSLNVSWPVAMPTRFRSRFGSSNCPLSEPPRADINARANI